MRGQSMGSSLIVALKNRVNGLDFSILGHSCLWKVFAEKQQGEGLFIFGWSRGATELLTVRDGGPLAETEHLTTLFRRS